MTPAVGWTVKEYAAMWGVPVTRVNEWIRSGRLTCLAPTPRTRRIRSEDHEAFMAASVLTLPDEVARRRQTRRHRAA